MPALDARCPECDARVRRTVDEPGEYDLKCPECGHTFAADTADAAPRYQPRAAKSKKPLVIGAAVGAALLAAVIVAVVLALGGPKDKPVAQNVEPPAKAKPAPKLELPKVGPPKTEPPKAEPPVTPPEMPAVPPEMPGEPGVVVPPPPPPAEDPFARAATFKPDGPLPELPPLPAADQRPLLALDAGGHTAFPKHVFFTPNADRVISVAEDKTVRVWDVASGEAVRTIHLPAGADGEGTPHAAALSPDGKRLAVGGTPVGNGKLGTPFYLIDVDTGELTDTVTGAQGIVLALDFSPDGRSLAVGSHRGTLQVYDFAAKKWVYLALAHRDEVVRARFSPKGDMLATVARDKRVRVWRATEAAKPVADIDLSTEGPNDLQWAAGGAELAVGCTNGEVVYFDPTGAKVRTVPPALENGKHPIQVTRLALLPGDKQFVFGGVAALGWAGVADVATGARPVIVREHTNTVMAVARSADGELTASAGGSNNEILVWETKTSAVVRKFQSASKVLWAVGWAKDGHALAWGDTNRFDDNRLCPLDAALRLDDFRPLPKPKSEDYARHAHAAGDLSLKVESFTEISVSENANPLWRHTSLTSRIYSATFVPGKGVVVGGSGRVYLLDAKTGAFVRDFTGDRGLTTALAPSPDGRYFAGASSDQVVLVWSPDRVEPVLSVFAVGREWIAWTPEGYYACSPFGERLIAWQVNNGIDKLPAVHPAARFRASLYQPDLLKYLIPAGDLRTAMAMSAQFGKQPVVAAVVGEVLPPNVAVTAPQTADDKPVTIRATAEGTDKHPILSMRLLIDGRPFNGAAGVKRFNKQAKAEAEWTVTLEPGAHTVAVLAESPVSKGMSATATVTRAGAAEKPNLYVLAMGVSAYPGDAKLNFAASDAILLSRTIQDKSRRVFGKIEMKVMTDKQVTKAGIGEGLDWLKSKMTATDIGIVSFSGHGGRDDAGKFYLIPIDIKSNLEKTGFSGEEFKSRLEDMPGRVVAILDACHSGAVTEVKSGRPDNLLRDLTADDYGVVVLASSLGSEFSLESPTTKAGLYTLGLTEALSGKADYNRDGVVHLNELEKYVSMRVQQLSGGAQTPTAARPPTIKPFALARP